jgi:hypothetical protein
MGATQVYLYDSDTKKKLNQGCQSHFGRCFVFSIGMECFSFGVFRRAVSGLYCSYIYKFNKHNSNSR